MALIVLNKEMSVGEDQDLVVLGYDAKGFSEQLAQQDQAGSGDYRDIVRPPVNVMTAEELRNEAARVHEEELQARRQVEASAPAGYLALKSSQSE